MNEKTTMSIRRIVLQSKMVPFWSLIVEMAISRSSVLTSLVMRRLISSLYLITLPNQLRIAACRATMARSLPMARLVLVKRIPSRALRDRCWTRRQTQSLPWMMPTLILKKIKIEASCRGRSSTSSSASRPNNLWLTNKETGQLWSSWWSAASWRYTMNRSWTCWNLSPSIWI